MSPRRAGWDADLAAAREVEGSGGRSIDENARLHRSVPAWVQTADIWFDVMTSLRWANYKPKQRYAASQFHAARLRKFTFLGNKHLVVDVLGAFHGGL